MKINICNKILTLKPESEAEFDQIERVAKQAEGNEIKCEIRVQWGVQAIDFALQKGDSQRKA